MSTSTDPAAFAPNPFWNRRMVPFMAASVGFLFLSFILVSIFAWLYTDATAQAGRVRDLGARLASQDPGQEPAAPSPALAGRVVYVRGAATGPTVVDPDTKISFHGVVAVERTVEKYRGGRAAGWRLEDISILPAPDARVGAWTLTGPLLAAAPETLRTLRPKADFQPPAGLSLSETEPLGVYVANGKPALTDDPAHRRSDGDRRMTYRALPAGLISVIAVADPTGQALGPLKIDGVNVALLASGALDPAALADAAAKHADATVVKTMLTALAVAWALFIIPAVWTPLSRRAAFTAAPLAGAAATLAAAMAAAPAGIAAAYLAGQTAAALYLAAMAYFARNRQ